MSIETFCSLRWSTEIIVETETLCQSSAHTSAGVANVECDTYSDEGERHFSQGFTRRKAHTESTVEMPRGVGGCGRGF
jgi:hypothetical protein